MTTKLKRKANQVGTSVLSPYIKRTFDPSNKEDLLEYRYFLKKGSWKSTVCPFELKWPHLGIPQMINDQIAKHYITKVLKVKD